MDIENISKIITILGGIWVIWSGWQALQRERTKGRVEQGKSEVEILEKLTLALEGSYNPRVVESMFRSISGVDCHFKVVESIFSSGYSLNKMPYLARMANYHLTISSGRLVPINKHPVFGIIFYDVLTLLIILLALFISITATYKGGTVSLLLIAFTLILFLIFASLVRYSTGFLDALVLCNYNSSNSYVTREIEKRRKVSGIS